ncbi:amino acid ABC transporter ATP-binding protein [Fundicoccus ignavus]|uniref:ATP-binding cassette domain-containing protein n=1 Tax=Fundicoccus ignavus TaxID=2664442 RepID=A0A844C9Y6_9LACT|nr:amino acid ABC transporter ATP-binding protein [Fundicoccus ignavus]MRJ45980.1 ATP-binding cassette domain-containing protein [Fundicoccus ignavus]
MIQLKQLSKSFGQQEVLKELDLSIAKGEVVALIGKSGAGKSTLLRTINWLDKPTQGTIQIGQDKIDAVGFTQEDVRKIRSYSSMVFQHYNLFKNKTVLENVMEHLVVVKRLSREEARDKAIAVLTRVGMSHKLNDFPSRLSGGQQQRVGIARALASDPDIMLFDEPTSALDPEWVIEILEVIRDIAQDGITMVIVSHEMNFVKKVASRVIFLDGGRIVEDAAPDEMFLEPKHERTKRFLNRLLQEF